MGSSRSARPQPPASSEPQLHVVALDFGMKWNIARHLFDLGCRVTIRARHRHAAGGSGAEP